MMARSILMNRLHYSRTKPLEAAALFLALVGLLGLAACNRTSVERPGELPLPFPTISAKGVWPQAVTQAQDWRHDAYVANLSINFDFTDGEGAFDTIDFSFESPSDDEESLWVICDYSQCASEVLKQNETYPERRTDPIEVDDFTLEGREALEISLAHGGYSYISVMQQRCIPTFAMLTRMDPPYTGELYWRASYLDTATRQHLDVIIDANTGEVVEVKD